MGYVVQGVGSTGTKHHDVNFEYHIPKMCTVHSISQDC